VHVKVARKLTRRHECKQPKSRDLHGDVNDDSALNDPINDSDNFVRYMNDLRRLVFQECIDAFLT
jgi:heme oxygenase